MKIRSGFVSNSSSSSYIVMGIKFDDLKKLEEAFLPGKLEEIKQKIESHNSDENNKYEMIGNVAEWFEDLVTYRDDYDDGLLFGHCINDVYWLNKLSTMEDLNKSFGEAKEIVAEYFGEEKAKKVALWGIKGDI